MTQLGKDRLIEKFMGWELKLVTDYDLNQWCFVNKHTGKTISGMYNDSKLPYCTDWNWLMEALYQFDNLYEFWDDKDEFFIERHSDYSRICDQIDYAVTLYNIDDAVNALCEGIEWYNSTSN